MRWLFVALLGAMGVVVALEALGHVLPVSSATLTDYYLDDAIITYPPNHRWTVSTGWDLRNPRSLQANNLGFVADRNFQPDSRAIAVVGDSYVEAGMLDAPYRPAAQLQALLGAGTPVYALGSPGTSLLDYAERVRFARTRLDVRRFVLVMEPGDVRQALCGSGNVHASCLDPQDLRPRTERLVKPSTAKRWLRHSALAQYLVGQLKLDGGRLLEMMRIGLGQAPDAGRAAPATSRLNASATEAQRLLARRQAVVNAVADEFMQRMRALDLQEWVLVADGRRRGSALSPDSEPMLERDAFLARMRAQGVLVIDGEESFRAHEARGGHTLSVSPSDAHLNRDGVALLMGAVARVLQ